MSEKTNIPWTDHTASPWLVCSEVDQCCDNCYAREEAKKNHSWTKADGRAGMIRKAYRSAGYEHWATMPVWGDEAPRVRTIGFWDLALKLNKKAEGALVRPGMFTSVMDWLDKMPAGAVDQFGHRLTRLELVADFLHTIWLCPNLCWRLLTKRPQNWRDTLPEVRELYGKASCNDAFCVWLDNWMQGDPPPNVWFGYSAGTRATWLKRHAISWDIPAVVTWCSAEPLLEPLYFHDLLRHEPALTSHNLDWLVVGLESGFKRRDIGVQALIDLVGDAQRHGCKVFTKQDCAMMPDQQGRIPDEIWRIREYPTSREEAGFGRA